MFKNLPHLWVVSAITRPAIFIVSHSVYIGPVIILALLRGRRIARVISREGTGLQLIFLISFVFAVNAESRQLLAFWPFLVAALCRAVADEEWSVGQLSTVAAMILIFSKVWLPINGQPLAGDVLDFPLQKFFMNIGPWMNDRMYVIQAAVCIATALLLRFFLPHHDNASVTSRRLGTR